MLYSSLRPLLFKLDPEITHRIALSTLKYAYKLKLFHEQPIDCKHHKIMGLDFPNRVGLAAGLDKNGAHIKELAALGFGFIEIGTVTPRPQPGNPKPRLFRITQANALINRLGFNNSGIDTVLQNIKNAKYQGILGVNIGKNIDTPIEKACDDYLKCMRKIYFCASYIVVNISSPNTPGLRELQNKEELDLLLNKLKSEQIRLADIHGKYTPLVIKIAPDLELAQITSISMLLIKYKIDGIIATNSTISRNKINHLPSSLESGGLSGSPLTKLATNIIYQLNSILQGAIPIIGVGGFMCSSDVQEKLDAGASLVQIYTGLIYHGPQLVHDAVKIACK